ETYTDPDHAEYNIKVPPPPPVQKPKPPIQRNFVIHTRDSLPPRVILTTSVSRPQLKSNPQGDRVLRSNSRGKKLEVEEHRRNVMLPKNKMSVTACNDSLNAKNVNVNFVSAMCAKCVMIDKHDLCVPKYGATVH
nr:hypothetical protein [Tanacetum cinerariifolium]